MDATLKQRGSTLHSFESRGMSSVPWYSDSNSDIDQSIADHGEESWCRAPQSSYRIYEFMLDLECLAYSLEDSFYDLHMRRWKRGRRNFNGGK